MLASWIGYLVLPARGQASAATMKEAAIPPVVGRTAGRASASAATTIGGPGRSSWCLGPEVGVAGRQEAYGQAQGGLYESAAEAV